LLRCFQARSALLPRQEPLHAKRIDVLLPLGTKQSMRWKISHRGHDARHIDLMAALALVIVIIAACRFFSGGSEAPSTAAFIVPSQSVRW
jgi:hypothetical protein